MTTTHASTPGPDRQGILMSGLAGFLGPAVPSAILMFIAIMMVRSGPRFPPWEAVIIAIEWLIPLSSAVIAAGAYHFGFRRGARAAGARPEGVE